MNGKIGFIQHFTIINYNFNDVPEEIKCNDLFIYEWLLNPFMNGY